MKNSVEQIDFFTIFDTYKTVTRKEKDPIFVADLLSKMFFAKKNIEYEIFTSVYFYRILMQYVDLINQKRITVKNLLLRGKYTKEQLKSKLGLFLLILKAFKKYRTTKSLFDKNELYDLMVKFGFNTNKLNNIKKLILNKTIKTSNIFYNNIIKQQDIINKNTHKLLEIHAPLAIDLAKKKGSIYSDTGKVITNYQEDLIQVGLVGILTAIEHWEPNRNSAFATYAWYWIENEFSKFYSTRDIVLLPKNLIVLRNKINRVSNKYGIEKNNISDFKEFFSFSDRRLEAAMSNEGCISINEIANDENDVDDNCFDFLTDGQDVLEDVSSQTNLDIISKILKNRLSDKEQKILNMRFGFRPEKEHLLSDIADEFGMTIEGIRKTIKNSLVKIIPDIVKTFGEEYGQENIKKVLEMHSPKRKRMHRSKNRLNNK